MPPAPFIIPENKYERRTFRFLQIFFTRQFCYHIHTLNIAI